MAQAAYWRPVLVSFVLTGAVAFFFHSTANSQDVGRESIPASVIGRVVDANSGAAIPDAVVDLPLGVRIAHATTDASGRFRIDGVPPGTFRLSAHAAGYVARSHSRTQPEARAISVVIGGAAVQPIEVKLFRLASLSGRILDTGGEPVAGIVVRALRPALREGPPLPRVAPVRSDDRGRYAFTELEPGPWVVAVPFTTVSESPGGQAIRLVGAAPQPLLRIGDVGVRTTATSTASTAVIGIRGEELLIRQSMFFRRATNVGSAEFVTVRAGEKRDDLDFTLSEASGRIVSGQLIAPADAAASVTVTLRNAEGSDLFVDSVFDVASTSTKAPGRFVLAGVPPGRYVLHVDVVPGRIADVGDDQPRLNSNLFAREPITVAGQDLTDLRIPLRSGFTVSGRVVWDGVPPKLSNTLTLRMTDQSPSAVGLRRSQVSTVVSDAGEFQMTGLLPGVYSFFVVAPQPWRLGHLRLGRGSSGVRPIEITADAADVELVLTARFGSLAVNLRAPDMTTVVPPTRVIVFSAERMMWTDAYLDALRFRDESAMAGDTLTFAGLPIGEYFVALVDDRRFDPRWRRAAALESLAARAVRASVGDQQVVSVPLTFRDRY